MISGVCSKPPPLSGTGCESGMNGTQFDGVDVHDADHDHRGDDGQLDRDDDLVDPAGELGAADQHPITTSAMTTAGRSMKPSEAEASEVGTSSGVPSSSDWR